jgi:hypothetical protein
LLQVPLSNLIIPPGFHFSFIPLSAIEMFSFLFRNPHSEFRI